MSPLILLSGLMLLGITVLGFALVSMLRKGGSKVDDRLAQFTGGSSETTAPALTERINEAVTKTERGSSIARDA